MEKWIINKYGFINFWLFDDEQLSTSGGNLLLNGENGSGKSVTLQSFIPLILDGNTNSNRLSTEGDMSRKIDYYILFGNKEENISYLYAEFVKEYMGKKEYITFGIGFRMRRGQVRPNKWYFSLRDMRIGEDIKLYRQEKSYKYTFGKNELKKALLKNAPDNHKIFDKREEYKNEVNNVLFGFPNIDEYDETLNLILELRKPSLKDSSGFDPKFIYDILNRSLKSLPENELMNMSESFENIEKISKDLETIELQNKSLLKIEEKYKRYNEVILKERLDNYLRVYHELKRVRQELSESRHELKTANETIEKGKARIERLEFEKSSKERRILELSSNKEFADIQSNYELVKNRIAELEKEEKVLQDKSKKFRKMLNDSEQNLKQEKKKYEIKSENLKNILLNLKNYKAELNFNSIIDFDDFTKENKKIDIKIIENEFKEFESRLTKVIGLIKENEKTAIRLNEAINNKTSFEEELLMNRKDHRELLEKFSEGKDNLITELEDKNRENSYLYFTKEDFGNIEEFIFEDEEKGKLDKIQNYVFEIKDRVKNIFNKEKFEVQNDKKLLNERKSDLEKQIKILENEEDIELDLSKEFTSERKKLDKGTYSEFYKTVKFRENIEEGIKNRIEKALLDSGILGAILSENNQVEIYDKFLISISEKAENLFEYLELEDGVFNQEIVEKFLKSISTNSDKKNYITTDGRYRLGSLVGMASPEYKSRYIGVEARKRLKEEKIANLKKDIKEIENEIAITELKLDEIKEKFENLKLEYKNFSDLIKSSKIKAYEEKITKNIYDNQTIKSGIEKWKKHELQLNILIDENKKRIAVILAGYKIYLENYEQVEKKLISFKNLFISIKSEYLILNSVKETIQRSENELENYSDFYEENRKNITKIKSELKENEEKRKLYREKLENEEYKSFRFEVEELNKRVNVEIPNLLREIDRKISARLEKIRHLNEKIKDYELREKKNSETHDIYDYLLEVELRNDYTNLNEEFKEIKDKQRLRDRLRKRLGADEDRNDSFNELSQVLNQEARALTNYHLELKDYEYDHSKIHMFDNNFILNKRSIITGTMTGKKVEFSLILKENSEHLLATKDVLNEEERRFFEDFLFNEIGRGINRRVKESIEWVKKIDEIMNITPTSSGKKYKLKWEAKTVDKNEGMVADSVVKILGNKYSKDANKIKSYFKTTVKQLQEENEQKALRKSNFEIIKEVLDYRNWYEFKLIVVESGGKEYNLTKKRLNSYSGGEKVMAVYIPLFSALYARFTNARKDGLKMIAMDEAFSVVDDENIEKLFGILEYLDINYLLASQKLTGTYKTVKNIAIVHIENPVSKQLVKPEDGYISLIKYLWNGVMREKDLRGATQTLF